MTHASTLLVVGSSAEVIDTDNMTKDYYVTLTGSKNNSGDFLIKRRARELFSATRSDRDIVDIDGWREFDASTLDLVNGARALILLGGPALQKKMRPRVYALVPNLSSIKVPIATMGIGWYSRRGRWQDTHNYPLNCASRDLLDRVSEDGLLSSVRDFHTLNVLNAMGYDNYMMTGCPALFDLDHFSTHTRLPKEVRKVGISLGVSLVQSPRMFRQMQELVKALREYYAGSLVEVAFHHSLGDTYLRAHGASIALHKAQLRFRDWLVGEGGSYSDISGSSEKLMNFYDSCDFHVGYRVHAHIFMSSVSKPSILLHEDGRGVALENVIGGLSFNAFDQCNDHFMVRLLHDLGIPFDNYRPAKHLVNDIIKSIAYESEYGVRFDSVRRNINEYYAVMKRFLEQLP